jgi:hypothetical protein
MITFLNCYLIIGVIIASLSIWAINTVGIDYLLKDIEPKIDIDFNKFSTQLIFVLIIIVLWPIIFLSKDD